MQTVKWLTNEIFPSVRLFYQFKCGMHEDHSLVFCDTLGVIQVVHVGKDFTLHICLQISDSCQKILPEIALDRRIDMYRTFVISKLTLICVVL